jgi:hypothetical protein
MKLFIAACLMAAAVAAGGAPIAAADPEDLIPYCSGDQTPMDNNCRQMSHQVFTHDAVGANPDVGLGTNPNVPVGTNPGVQPAT